MTTETRIESESLAIQDIEINGAFQPRERLDREKIAEYAALMEGGIDFPPIVVFLDDRGTYWLADGFHRVEAAGKNGNEILIAEVHQGGRQDAALYACGANSRHGLPLTNADKRRVVTRLLQDEAWFAWSDREVARHCGVSQPYVSTLRKDLTDNVISERTYRTKHGTVATMDTSHIGSTTNSTPVRTEPPQLIPTAESETVVVEETQEIDTDDDVFDEADPHVGKPQLPGRRRRERTIQQYLEEYYPEPQTRPTPTQWLVDDIVARLVDRPRMSGGISRTGITLALVQEAVSHIVPRYTEVVQDMMEDAREDGDEEAAHEYEQWLVRNYETEEHSRATIRQIWETMSEDTQHDFLLAIGAITPMQDPRRSPTTRVLEAIQHVPSKTITVAHIADLTHLVPRRVSTMVFQLKKQGRIKEVRRGEYSASKKGDA